MLLQKIVNNINPDPDFYHNFSNEHMIPYVKIISGYDLTLSKTIHNSKRKSLNGQYVYMEVLLFIDDKLQLPTRFKRTVIEVAKG